MTTIAARLDENLSNLPSHHMTLPSPPHASVLYTVRHFVTQKKHHTTCHNQDVIQQQPFIHMTRHDTTQKKKLQDTSHKDTLECIKLNLISLHHISLPYNHYTAPHDITEPHNTILPIT